MTFAAENMGVCISDSVQTDAVILCQSAPSQSDICAAKIAEFMGAEPSFLCLDACKGGEFSLARVLPKARCLVAHAETLIRVFEDSNAGDATVRKLIRGAAHIFIYGFQTGGSHGALLRKLSNGALSEVQSIAVGESSFRVSARYRQWCGAFSGSKVETVDHRIDKCFVETKPPGAEPLIYAGSKPFLINVNFEGANLFLSGCRELADLDTELTRQDHLSKWFSRLVPLMICLRAALGDRLWHAETPRACLIIDDPLLKDRHGFLKMRHLLETIQRQGSSVSIAFIPWNYNRSKREIADLFYTRSNQASLCVHGCDHSGGEFALGDRIQLTRKAELALLRMEEHRNLYGVGFDPIMVFPQGLFSREALSALQAAGYIAAINSDPNPSPTVEALKLRELLAVAVTRFSGFPLFVRRYPHDLIGLAFDLFLGKPALIVEHHAFFQRGYKALEDLVSELRAMDQRLEWTNPGLICSTACVTRITASGEIHTRFWTNHFRITNCGNGTTSYVLLRPWNAADPVPSVTVNDQNVRCQLRDEFIEIRLKLKQRESADVSVLPPAAACRSAEQPVLKSMNLAVRLRRILCELRDNYVDTNPVLRAVVSYIRMLILSVRFNPRTSQLQG